MGLKTKSIMIESTVEESLETISFLEKRGYHFQGSAEEKINQLEDYKEKEIAKYAKCDMLLIHRNDIEAIIERYQNRRIKMIMNADPNNCDDNHKLGILDGIISANQSWLDFIEEFKKV